MKTFLSFLFLLLVVNANAKNYYFSSTSGDDSRTAAQATNSATPWKSIGKLNSNFSILLPGDSVLFKRGDVFYGAITVAKSGTASAPIVFSAYGSGNKPVISSLVTLNNWTSVGSGIYESSNSALGADINIILFNGKQQEMGRYPNSETANNGYLIYESHVGITSITDNELSSSVNWTGAELVLRTRRWVLDRNLIKSHSGNTITYTSASSYEPYDDNGYFIQNSIKTLDRLGEWYYNPSNKKLSMYFGSNSPSSFAVQASALEDLISVTSYNYLVFDNMEIRGANGSGIKIKNGNHITIKNCDVDFSGQDGINVSSHDYLKVENSTVTNSNENGINLNYSGDYATIRNNKVTNTALFLGFNGNGDGKGIGIKTFGNGNVVEYNEILNTGYIGIYFNGNNAVIKNNLVDRFCMSKDDGAGIYTWQGDVADYKNRKLIGNIVVNGVGAGPGTDNPTYFPVEGIYFDNGASFVECRDNTIANCGNNGVYLHNAHDLVLRNNTFYNCSRQFTAIQKENNIAMRNNVITNNIFFSKQVTQLASYLKSNLNDIKDFGKMDSNYYARPLDDRLVIYNNYVKNGSGVTENFVLENWKDKYNKDLASKRTAKQIAPYRLNKLLSTNKTTNGLFASNVTGVQKSSCTATWSNDGKMDGGYLVVTPTSRNSTVYLSVGALTAGKKYILKYTIKGSIDSSSTVSTYLRQALSPYTNLTPAQSRAITSNKSDNEVLFTCPTTESSATVVFRVDDQVKYYLDNIYLYEADALITNVDDSLRFEYNASKNTKTISLGDDYVDAKNNKYSGSITLQPYASAVLIKQNSSSSSIPANVAPAVSLTSPAANAGFTSPATISIAATATDADGTVSKVDFYNGSTLIGTDSTSPYAYNWSNVSAGSYTITAKAKDDDGAVTTSSSVTISVTSPANVAPAVSLTSPAANAGFTSPATISIAATATDADGTVSKVDFYNGSTLIGTDSTSPYAYSWSNVSAGSYTITAKAKDDDGALTTSSSVTVSVSSPANVAPAVSLTSPAANAGFTSPATISIAATATDADGTVSKVDFYNGSTLIGTDSTSPYAYNWSNVSAGSYTITAKAKDDDGALTTSSSVTISVTSPANVAPAVSLTSPAANAGFTSPATISIAATATDADGTVSKVDFYNGSTLLGTDSTSPYAYNWSNVSAGSYTITAKAKDDDGAVTTSSSVTVSVSSPANVAPAVSLTSPAANAGFTSPATISIAATATDIDGTVSKVDFYNGSTLLGTDSTSPYAYNWSNVSAGSYTITAKAKDDNGAVTTSSSVTVSVTSPANVAPAVSLTSPAANAGFTSPATISIAATATDTDGIVSKVDFYNGSILLGTDSTSPYAYNWSNVSAGSYTITAKAKDDDGAITTSSSVIISVSSPVSSPANVAPAVKITSPTNNSTFNSNSSVTISASASDIDGKITMVQFYSESGLIKTEYTAPYTFTVVNLSVGTHTITAKATDDSGAVTTSESVSVTISEVANLSPRVTLTSPETGSTYTSQAYIRVTADAADTDGTIKKVLFYSGSTLIKTENYAPYDFTWSNVSAGTYKITAKAIDNDGAITKSSTVTITVNEPATLTAATTSTTMLSADNNLVSKKQLPSISVSPNPAFNTINVSASLFKTNQDMTVSILSSTGNILQTMKTTSSSQSIKMDVSSLVNGSYFVQAVSGKQKAIYQFIKQ